MIWLSFRLAFADGRRSLIAAVIMGLTVACGTTVLLVSLSVGPASDRRSDRSAWMNINDITFPEDQKALVKSGRFLFQSSTVDYFTKDSITLVHVAGKGTDLPRPPGLPTIPPAGESYVSPAVAKLLEGSPTLARRYPKVIGILGPELLPGPKSLVVLEGVAVSELAGPATTQVTSYPRTGGSQPGSPLERLLLVVGTVSLLLPLVLLLGSASNLAAASRTKRFAALRLAGATQAQISQLAAGESLLIGCAGVGLGLLAWRGLRGTIAQLSSDGSQWFPADISPGLPLLLVVAFGVPVLTALATQQRLARLGAGRLLGLLGRQRVRWWRVLPFILVLGVLALVLRPGSGTSTRALGFTFLGLLISLLYLGPYLTKSLARVIRQFPRPAALLAGSRLYQDPQAGFLTTAGVTIAVLIATLFAAATPGASESVADSRITGIAAASAQIYLTGSSPSQIAKISARLRQSPAVSQSAAIYQAMMLNADRKAWVGDCAEIVASARISGVTCAGRPAVLAEKSLSIPPGATFTLDEVYRVQADEGSAISMPEFTTPAVTGSLPNSTAIDTPDVIISPTVVAKLLPQFKPARLLVALSPAGDVDDIRTLVHEISPTAEVQTRESTFDGFSLGVRSLNSWVRALLLVVFGISAFGLMVALAVGLLERRRPFALLRAAGTPVRTLKWACFLEVFAPLLVMSLLAALVGAVSGRLLVNAGQQSQQATWGALFAPTATGLAVAVVLLCTSLVLVRRVTDTEETRFE